MTASENDHIKPTGETIEVAGQTLRWAHDTRRCGVMYHALLDEEGLVLGSHPSQEESIRQAKFHLYPKLERMTPEQFREIVLVIPVVRGCSANSSRTMGRQSENCYLVDDIFGEGCATLRAEALRVYDLKPEDDRPDDRDKFPEQFMSAILGGVDRHFDIDLKCGKDLRPIVLINTYRWGNMRMDGIIKTAYDIYADQTDDASHKPSRMKP